MKIIYLITLVMFAFSLIGTLKCDVAEITVVPGQIVTFNIEVLNKEVEQDIPLSAYLPSGFSGEFVYQSKVVNSIHLNTSESMQLQYRLHVGKDVREGSYWITLSALDSYTIRVNVEKPENALDITSSISGAYGEAGDVIEFPVAVRNLVFGSYDVELKCRVPEGWECKFLDGGMEVFRITLQAGEERQITLRVDTDSSSEVGMYHVEAYFNTQKYPLSIFITETHKGEKGEVRFKVVDRNGVGVGEAKVLVGNSTFYTSTEGEAIFELPAGVYNIKIEKGGYYGKELKDVKVRAGKTNDLGTIYLEKKPYYVTISVSNPRLSAVIGEKPEFRFRIENRGYAADSYTLSVSNLPQNFYAKFRDENGEISEVYLEGGEVRDLSLQILTPPTAKPGIYNLTINAVGKAKASKNVTLRLIGEYNLRFEPVGGRYLFTVEQGEEVGIDAVLGNYGRGVAVTNINISVSAPKGWSVRIVPASILSLNPMERLPVKIHVHVPPDTIPSEYKLSFTVKSDQIEAKEEIKIVVKEKSYARVIGIAVITAAVLFLIYVFRKFGRR